MGRKSTKMVLAVVCPQMGYPTETFVTKHINRIAPGRTVVLTGKVYAKGWFSGPVKTIPIVKGRYFFSEELDGEILRFLKANSVTHILCEFGCIGGAVIELNSRTLHLPVFVHFHGEDASHFLRYEEFVSYYKWMGKQARGVIAVSEPMAERLIKIGIPSKKIKVVHSGVDVNEVIHSTPEKSPCRFILISRFVPKKGILYALKAFKKAWAALPGIKMDVIGDGPLRREIEGYISEHDLKGPVTLHGWRSHRFVLRMLDKCSVLVQHSMTDPKTGNREGLPVSILEAAAHGLPVISTFHEGIPEAVEHGKTGFLVNERDVKKMAEYMVELGENGDLRKAMGIAGHDKMLRDGFSTQDSIGSLRRFIHRSGR